MGGKDPLSRVGEDTEIQRDAGAGAEPLPYQVELWDEAGAGVKRVLARLSSPMLAQAAFEAAVSEHVDRRITLRHGARVIADKG